MTDNPDPDSTDQNQSTEDAMDTPPPDASSDSGVDADSNDIDASSESSEASEPSVDDSANSGLPRNREATCSG